MTITELLGEYLEGEGVRYSVLKHPKAYAAQEVAALTHVSGKELAKTVIVKSGDRLLMSVLPADHRIDLAALSLAVGADVRLATEAEFEDHFLDCEVGAMPPFGNRYRMEVWIAEPLTQGTEIVFHAGTHTEAFRILYCDLARLAMPRVAQFSHPESEAPGPPPS